MSFGLVQGNRYVFRESMELRRVVILGMGWDDWVGVPSYDMGYAHANKANVDTVL